MQKLFSFLIILNCTCAVADSWTQRANITGVRNGAVGFSIGDKGYIGTGYNSGAFTRYKDFWEYDPDSNVWTQKADFGGGFRDGAVGFSIGEKGYIGLGLGTGGHQIDFWEWDQANNSWSRKADFLGSIRDGAVGFSIGNKGYVGTGGSNGTASGLLKDFWEWDGDTLSASYNTWTQKSDFGGTARGAASGFSMGTKGYIGTGSTDGTTQGGTKDFWEWDGDTLSATYNTWIQKTALVGVSRAAAVGFSIGQKGYIGTGADTLGLNKKDFWEYDQATNAWTRKTDFGGYQREGATGFSIGNKGYIGMGFFFSVSTNDFWEYCDTCSGVGINELSNAIDISVFPNPASENITVTTKENYKNIRAELYNISGEKIFEKSYYNVSSSFQIDVSNFSNGIYFIRLQTEKKSVIQKIIIQN